MSDKSNESLSGFRPNLESECQSAPGPNGKRDLYFKQRRGNVCHDEGRGRGKTKKRCLLPLSFTRDVLSVAVKVKPSAETVRSHRS
ncbi:hypothetical protein MHYP_G00240730 [Metynnis hypsauchen]